MAGDGSSNPQDSTNNDSKDPSDDRPQLPLKFLDQSLDYSRDFHLVDHRILFRTHKGFVKSSDFVYSHIRPWVERFYRKYSEQEYRFVFTGHSLGAATAALVYYKYPTLANKRLVLFGCPGMILFPWEEEEELRKLRVPGDKNEENSVGRGGPAPGPGYGGSASYNRAKKEQRRSQTQDIESEGSKNQSAATSGKLPVGGTGIQVVQVRRGDNGGVLLPLSPDGKSPDGNSPSNQLQPSPNATTGGATAGSKFNDSILSSPGGASRGAVDDSIAISADSSPVKLDEGSTPKLGQELVVDDSGLISINRDSKNPTVSADGQKSPKSGKSPKAKSGGGKASSSSAASASRDSEPPLSPLGDNNLLSPGREPIGRKLQSVQHGGIAGVEDTVGSNDNPDVNGDFDNFDYEDPGLQQEFITMSALYDIPVDTDARILHVVRGKDFISNMSLQSFDRLADEIVESSYVNQAVNWISDSFASVGNGFNSWFGNHRHNNVGDSRSNSPHSGNRSSPHSGKGGSPNSSPNASFANTQGQSKGSHSGGLVVGNSGASSSSAGYPGDSTGPGIKGGSKSPGSPGDAGGFFSNFWSSSPEKQSKSKGADTVSGTNSHGAGSGRLKPPRRPDSGNNTRRKSGQPLQLPKHHPCLIPRPPGKLTMHLQVRPSHCAPRIYWVRTNHGDHYRRILVGLRMIDDHLPNLYLASLCDVYFNQFFNRTQLTEMEIIFLKMLKKIRFDYISAYEGARWI